MQGHTNVEVAVKVAKVTLKCQTIKSMDLRYRKGVLEGAENTKQNILVWLAFVRCHYTTLQGIINTTYWQVISTYSDNMLLLKYHLTVEQYKLHNYRPLNLFVEMLWCKTL